MIQTYLISVMIMITTVFWSRYGNEQIVKIHRKIFIMHVSLTCVYLLVNCNTYQDSAVHTYLTVHYLYHHVFYSTTTARTGHCFVTVNVNHFHQFNVLVYLMYLVIGSSKERNEIKSIPPNL